MFVRVVIVALLVAPVAFADPPKKLEQPAGTTACGCPENDGAYAASIPICFCDKAKRVRLYIAARGASTDRELDNARPKKLCSCKNTRDVCVCAGGQTITLWGESETELVPPSCHSKTYDGAGHVLEHAVFEGRRFAESYTSRYDAAGHRILDETRRADGAIRRRTLYRFDGDREVQSDEDSDGDGKRDVTVVKRYDAKGTLVGLDRWDTQAGRCTYAKECSPGRCECTFGSLPAGVVRPAAIVLE